MKRVIFVFFILISFTCEIQANNNIIINRLRFVYELKSYIADKIWPNFDSEIFDVPLIYYANNNCFIVNPTDLFIRNYKSELIFKEKSFEIYESQLLDSIPFHMAVGITFGDTTSDYNYKSPFINCSSVEIIQKTIPDVSSLEEWATMVIHEYFHGFQFKHKEFLDYFENNIAFTSSQKKLSQIYKTNERFKSNVDKENNILLSALASQDKNEIFKLIKQFFSLREERRNLTIQNLGFDIKNIEGVYETMEGTARYVEYSLYENFSRKASDDKLNSSVIQLNSDTLYHNYSFFSNFKLENAEWLYRADKTNYFYATGFNIIRLLDKLKVEYKSTLFNSGEATLEQILLKQCL